MTIAEPSAEARAFHIALAALREIANETCVMGPEATAEAALLAIWALVPDGDIH